MNTQIAIERLHPAAEWALEQQFDTSAVDCTTTVVLKILDGKCKMLPGEKAAIMEIYDVVRHQPAVIFGNEVHRIIDAARCDTESKTLASIHQLRVFAEAKIPKPVMKKYKALLREGLFG
jgi:hypothetical protein